MVVRPEDQAAGAEKVLVGLPGFQWTPPTSSVAVRRKRRGVQAQGG